MYIRHKTSFPFISSYTSDKSSDPLGRCLRMRQSPGCDQMDHPLKPFPTTTCVRMWSITRLEQLVLLKLGYACPLDVDREDQMSSEDKVIRRLARLLLKMETQGVSDNFVYQERLKKNQNVLQSVILVLLAFCLGVTVLSLSLC